MDFEQLTFLEYFLRVLDHFQTVISKAFQHHIQQILKKEPNSLEAPLIVTYTINYSEWSKNKELKPILDRILDEPLQSYADMRRATWLKIGSLMVETYSHMALQAAQVHCIIRISNLPFSKEFEFVPFRHPVRLGISVMKCVLQSFDERCTYVRQSVWYCPKQCHANQNDIFDGEYYVSHKCGNCDGNLKEYEDRRSTYDCRFIRVFDARSVEMSIRGKIHRDVKVKLSDDLCDVNMVLSQIYMLIGTYDILNQTYIAWNFEQYSKINPM